MLATILRGISRFLAVLTHVGIGLTGSGRATDEEARSLYEKPREYRH